MKLLNSSCFRAICILLLGILLVAYPAKTTELLVVAVGFAFLVPSLVYLIAYISAMRSKKNNPNGYTPRYPIMETGSLLFGLVLILMPTFFITILMYVLGALLVLFACNQIVNLISIRRFAKLSFGFYIIPLLILITGVLFLIDPVQIASSPFMILGICCIVSALSELLNLYRISKAKKSYDITVQVEEPTEIKDE